MDNIGVFDRRYLLPDGSKIEQSDGTAWMAMFSLSMLNIALELATEDPAYEDIADKFLNDFIYLAAAINARGTGGFTLWDDEDGFYYDVLRRPDGTVDYLRTRSMVGLTPLFAVESFDTDIARRFPLLRKRVQWFRERRAHLLDQLHHIGVEVQGRRLISLVPPERLRRICKHLFDEDEFLSHTEFERSPDTTLTIRIVLPRLAKPKRSAIARRRVLWQCSAATRTGAVRSGCR